MEYAYQKITTTLKRVEQKSIGVTQSGALATEGVADSDTLGKHPITKKAPRNAMLFPV